MIGRKQDRQKETLKRIAIGSGIAAAAGYLAGILTAPKSGKQTRGEIKAAAERGKNQAEKDLQKLTSELDELLGNAKSNGDKINAKGQKELESLVDKAKDSKEKVRQVLSAIQAGTTEDQDLKRAIKNANTALDHLRDYLKK